MSLDVYLTEVKETEIYNDNCTHNLTRMANAADLYYPLWRPDDLFPDDLEVRAAMLISRIEAGLTILKADPIYFKQFNPDNGWGDYEGLVEFTENYLQACKDNPEAIVRADR